MISECLIISIISFARSYLIYHAIYQLLGKLIFKYKSLAIKLVLK